MLSRQDEVDNGHCTISEGFQRSLEQTCRHFVLPRGHSVGHSVYKEIKFSECGHWVLQPFLPADSSVREDFRLLQEHDVPNYSLVQIVSL